MIKFMIMALALFMPFSATTAAEPAAAAATAFDAGVLVPGSFLSLAGRSDGSVFLLGTDHQLVRLAPDGASSALTLPPVVESKPDDRFCDLVVDGNNAWFCGFAFPVIFALDLEKPAEYQIVRASDPEAAALNLLNLDRRGSGFAIRDADGNTLVLENGKPISKLANHASLLCGMSGEPFIIPPPVPEAASSTVGSVVIHQAGGIFWKAPLPALPRVLKLVEFLGCDDQKRSIFLVITGSGELDSEFTLYAVSAEGKTLAEKKISGPSGLEMQRFCRLSPDGSILLAEKAPGNEPGVLVKKLRL